MTSRRPSNRATLALTLLTLLTAGCSTPAYQPPPEPKASRVLEQEQQRALALRQHQNDQNRLARIALPLQQAAAELCPQPLQAALGLRLGNQHFFHDKVRDAAVREWQLGDVLQVIAVLPGSAAAQAAVQPGDYLIQIDGTDFPTGESALTALPPLLQELVPDRPVPLSLMRDGQPVRVSITPQGICRYPLLLLNRDEINAYATHSRIEVTRGMLRFAADDWELAFVIAHEMAHNLRGHIPAALRNGALAGLIDLWLLANGVPSPGLLAMGGSRAYSKAFEREADYLALYLMANAGYPLDHPADYWRRVAAQRPASNGDSSAATHPDNSDRYLAMRRTLTEIRRKQQQGLALTPSLRATVE